MKNKMIIAAAAAAAMLAMSVNVMAAGSISGAIDYNNVTATTGSSSEEEAAGANLVGGKDSVTTDTVGVTLSPVEPGMYAEELQEQVDAINQAPADSTLLDIFMGIFGEDDLPVISLYNSDGLLEEEMDLSEFKFLSPVMDLVLETEPTEENPVDVTFTANNMTDEIEVFILHYCGDHKWEMLENEKISDNQVTASFHSASPVALIYRELPEEESETDTDVVAP